MSAVLVGLLDQKIGNSHVVSWDINKIGGLPAWICTNSSPSVPECNSCGQASSLISQIYCPLGGSDYHRCIYLFACPGACNKQQNGWRVFRSMKRDSSYQPEFDQATEISQQPSKCLDEVWSHDQDDWGGESEEWGGESNQWDEGACVVPPCQESAHRPAGSDCGGAGSEAPVVSQPEIVCHDSGSPDSEAPVVTQPEIVYHDSGSPCSDTCLLQSIESLSQLVLSDEVPRQGCPANFTDNLGAACILASGDECQDIGEPAVEEMIALADTERWNAMAKLLNTKFEQDCAPANKRTIVFESYYLSVVDEPAAIVEEVSDHVNHLIRNYERSEGKQLQTMILDRHTSKGKEGSSELYEKTELKHGDRIFYKFMKRLLLCPQQCIRYDRGGDPLLVSSLQEEPVSPCPHCGRRRIFEFQLLPSLIPFLKTVDGTPCEVEFGTVLVYTCEQNCWPADHDPTCKLDLLEESIVLQGDPDTHLYR